MYYKTNYESPLGSVTLASDGENLVGLWFEGQKYYGGSVKNEMTQNDSVPVFADVKSWLDRYFGGERPLPSELPLAPNGGDFRKTVWNVLLEIPYGECITYGEVAKIVAVKLGRAGMSAQAVGGAVGHNPISVIIPCHRVVGAGGRLTGYAGGIEKKAGLLNQEQIIRTRF